MNKYFAYALIAMVSAMGLASGDAAAAEHGQMFTSLYYGRYTDTPFIENLQFDHDLEPSDILVLSIGKPIADIGDALTVEVEGQVGFHRGRQTHQEINGVLTLRWLPFPWDHYLDTSFAFGNGLSYASVDPVIERDNADNGQTAQLLYYLMAEWAFAPKADAAWEIFWRIHHRSGIYGRMAGTNAGANFIGIGVRWRFK